MTMNKLSFCATLLAIVFFLPSFAQTDDRKKNELFPFVVSYDAPDNVTNISRKLDAPAGKYGFVRVQDGKFFTDKGRIQFWGTNTCFGASFLNAAAADRMADRLARFGINCVRLHHMDMYDLWGGSNASTKMTFDRQQLDRLDYYIAALKKRGIYVNINLHVSRELDERDGFPPLKDRPLHDKGIDNYYRPLIEANKKYAKDLLEHVNPYTGKAYKEEPAVAMIEINNENSIITEWGGRGSLYVIQDPFLSDLNQLWVDWQKTKYGNGHQLVPVIWKKDVTKYPKEAVDDFCDFLLDTEAKYWDEMFRFLKDDIKVRQPVSGTQLQYGSTHAQAAMDYCDIHEYWNHPVFPGRAWDQNNWYLRNIALVNYLDKEIFPSLANSRVAGKPFTVSEYNHPYPNQYAGEGLPLLAAFGAMQGWDGIFPFDYYSSSRNIEPRMAGNFFSTAGNTVQMAHMIACHVLFCEGYNANADKMRIIAHLSFEKEREIFKQVKGPSHFEFRGLNLDPRLALLYPTGVDVTGKIESATAPFSIPDSQKKFTGEIQDLWWLFDMTEPGKGRAVLCKNESALFTGFFKEGNTYEFHDYRLQFGKTNLDWATLSLSKVSEENGKKRFLLVVTGEMLNTDMEIEQLGDDKITIGNRWGKEPVRCEGVPATLTFKNGTVGNTFRCWALDESGNRRQVVAIRKDSFGTAITMNPEYKTIWYELEVIN